MHQHGIGREIVEESGRPIEEQRYVELDTRGRNPLAHTPIDRGSSWIAFEARAEPPAKLAHTVRIERNLPGRQQPDALERIEGALGLRVEAPDRFDLVIEQI